MSSHDARWYLQSAHAESFGALVNDSMGDFGPGMNVVFGKNESGKSTWSSLIEGVLFGWPDGRSERNTYKPANAERSGRLCFANAEGERSVLTRVRNADGVNDEAALLADIDRETYQTVFALDSDELLALDNTSEITSHLLTAGSGTVASPARALAELDRRAAAHLSRAASAKDSIPQLTARIQELDAQIKAAKAQARAYLDESREYAELGPAREALSEHHDQLNSLIEGRTADLSLLQKLEEQVRLAYEQRAELVEELELLEASERGSSGARVGMDAHTGTGSAAPEDPAGELARLSSSEERVIRDTLDELQGVRERLSSEVDYAQRNVDRSQAAYEALVEQSQRDQRSEQRQRQLGQLVISIVLPLATLFVGVPTALYGRSIGSLSVTAFGVVLVGAALMMGIAAIIMLRPTQREANWDDRIADAEWALRQDEKKLATCERNLATHNQQIESYLRFNHLAAAGGSLRRARSLLEDAHEQRANHELYQHRRQALEQQLRSLERTIAQEEEQRDGLLEDAQVRTVAEFEALVNAAIEERRQLIERSEQADTRYGELANRLAQAGSSSEFHALKQERAACKARLAESKRNYACLLLARRNLAQAIQRWEETSQPEVYRRAGELLAQMTDGAWQEVRLAADGGVQVLSAQGERRDPALLSLGTRQQLYLCLRIALLLSAPTVGQAMPVLADDILVNFDAERRRAAAQALMALARHRQIILFTCHEEVRDLLCGPDAEAVLIELSPDHIGD